MAQGESDYDVVPVDASSGIRVLVKSPGNSQTDVSHAQPSSDYEKLGPQNQKSPSDHEYTDLNIHVNAVSKSSSRKRKKSCAKKALLFLLLSILSIAVAAVSIVMVKCEIAEYKSRLTMESLIEQFCENINQYQRNAVPCVIVDGQNDTTRNYTCTIYTDACINLTICL